jgi:hypothetical protein
MAKKLVWDEYSLARTAEVLFVINNNDGDSITEIEESIRSKAAMWIHEKDVPIFVGTAGWYVTAIERDGHPDALYCHTTVMAFAVRHYLNLLKDIKEMEHELKTNNLV